MTDLRKHPLPRHDGPVTVEYLEMVLREVLARQDVRNPQNDFAAGIVSSGTGVTLGALAKPVGRTVSVATLVDRITDTGTAEDQRFLPMVNTGNRLSAQNINPLSSTGSASTAQIAISSHTVTFGFGVVEYDSGTITGLDPLVTYFVYASDPGYEGGSVVYTATEDAPAVVSSDGYYYVGSITTANTGPTGNVTAATLTNPVQITTGSAHGLTTGEVVDFSAMPGDFAVLNSGTYTATVSSPTVFTVVTDATAFAAYTTGGTVTRVTTPTSGGGTGGGWNWQGEVP
jgi:hypothetical protein